MDTMTGQFKSFTQKFNVTDNPKGLQVGVTQMVISNDGKYLATADSMQGVCVFIKDHYKGDVTK